jgi:hypothetical protein
MRTIISTHLARSFERFKQIPKFIIYINHDSIKYSDRVLYFQQSKIDDAVLKICKKFPHHRIALFYNYPRDEKITIASNVYFVSNVTGVVECADPFHDNLDIPHLLPVVGNFNYLTVSNTEDYTTNDTSLDEACAKFVIACANRCCEAFPESYLYCEDEMSFDGIGNIDDTIVITRCSNDIIFAGNCDMLASIVGKLIVSPVGKFHSGGYFAWRVTLVLS